MLESYVFGCGGLAEKETRLTAGELLETCVEEIREKRMTGNAEHEQYKQARTNCF